LLASKQGPVPGGADSGEIVDRLMAALHRLKALIREVQRLAAVDAGSLDLKKEPIELTAVVDKAMGPFARARPFRIAIAPGTHVMGDEDRLTDVFRALFDNAVAFSPEGSPIEVVAKRDDDTILVSVVDGGKGIPSQDTQKIFERFAQREPPNTREVGGLGIGLPVARGIIERMGGTLDVVPGPRGHFVIALPGGE
jgi:signal transduction histidine kinase